MANYPPLFERIHLDPEVHGKMIQDTQKQFERFWKSVARKIPQNPEKTLAMRKMQEGCMWLTRAIAVASFSPDSGASKAIVKEAVNDLITIQSPVADKPKPTILVKTKKTLVKPIPATEVKSAETV